VSGSWIDNDKSADNGKTDPIVGNVEPLFWCVIVASATISVGGFCFIVKTMCGALLGLF